MNEDVLKIEAWVVPLDEAAVFENLRLVEADCAAQIVDPLRRLRHERGRWALRKVLGKRLSLNAEDVTLEIAPGGKPKVNGCEFSISHSGSWLVIAVSDAAMGVDIETRKRSRNVMELATRFFSASDARLLSNAAEEQREKIFLQQWVAKEAALKCEGVGLSNHLHKAECVMDKSVVLAVRWDEARFAIQEFLLPDGTPGAIAWRGDGKAYVEWHDATEINIS